MTKQFKELWAAAVRLLNRTGLGSEALRSDGPDLTLMRTSRFDMTSQKFDRYLREGRGRGAGKEYRPWIQVDDISSRGRVHRTASALTGYRKHHLLSDNEFYAYLNAWWDEDVLDIREQYPLLPVALTLGIASELGVKHPYNHKCRFAIPQTTDLLLVKKSGLEAVPVKEDEDYESPRTKQKLAIAEEFWRRQGVPTRISLSSMLKVQRSLNLQWIYQARRPSSERPYKPGESRLYDSLVSHAVGGRMSSLELASRTDAALALPSGTSLAGIRRLLSERVLITNIDQRDITKECEIFVGSMK